MESWQTGSRSKHPEDRLEGKSLGFSKKRRESCGGPELIDSSPMMAFEERHLGRDRFLYNSYQFGNSFSRKEFYYPVEQRTHR